VVVTNNQIGVNVSGNFTGGGAGLTGVNAAQLNGLSAANFWQLDGNTLDSGKYLGSANFQPVEIWVNNTRALRLEPTTIDANHSNIVNVVGGSPNNFIATGVYGSVIAGGGGYYGLLYSNAISADMSFVGGGVNNSIQLFAYDSFLGGGSFNSIRPSYSFLGGGNCNANMGGFSAIPGGFYNVAAAYSFAAGAYAQATNTYAFFWSDGSATTGSTNNYSVTMRASGGYQFFTSSGTVGAYLAAGGGSWTSISDRNAKENFQPVNPRGVLEKVAALPMSTWNYKSQDTSVRHIGPMAQDFKAAFDVGESETGITTIDADGVALAAIQGLNQKLEATRAENAALKQLVAELKQMILQLAQSRRND